MSSAPDLTEAALKPNSKEVGEWEELELFEKDGLIYFEIRWDAKQDILLSVERENGEDTDTLYLRATDKLEDTEEDATSDAPPVSTEEVGPQGSSSEKANQEQIESEPVREELSEESTDPAPEVKIYSGHFAVSRSRIPGMKQMESGIMSMRMATSLKISSFLLVKRCAIIWVRMVVCNMGFCRSEVKFITQI